MGQHKKARNKTYTAKPVRVPAIIPLATAADAHPELAMRLHTGIQWFIDNPTIESANNFSQQLCLVAGAMSHSIGGAPVLGRKDANSIAINSACHALQAICDRHDRTRVVSVMPLEAKTLIAATGRLDEVLHSVPAYCYDRADKELSEALAVEYAKTAEWKLREEYPTRAERLAEVRQAVGAA